MTRYDEVDYPGQDVVLRTYQDGHQVWIHKRQLVLSRKLEEAMWQRLMQQMQAEVGILAKYKAIPFAGLPHASIATVYEARH